MGYIGAMNETYRHLIDTFGQGWERGDTDLICSIFTPDATFVETPFRRVYNRMPVSKDMHDRLREIGKPTIARVQGIAVGGGNELQMACDLAVMAEDAFLSDPRVSLGLLDGAGGLVLWPLLTSLSAAKEHLLLGDRVSGTEAHRLGLANRAVPASDVLDEALRLATRLAALPPEAVRQARQLLNSHIDRAAVILEDCARAESACFDTEEHRVLLERLTARVAAKTAGTT